MRNKKFKGVFKNKKVVVISGLIAALTITVAGIIILNSKSKLEEKKQVMGEVNNNKSSMEKQLKAQLENLKQMDIYKLSEEDRESINNKIVSIGDMLDKNEYDKVKIELVNLTKYIEKKVMRIGNRKEETMEEKNEGINDTTQNNITNNNEQNNGAAQNKPNNNNISGFNKHTHSWNPITEQVYHDEVGHYEDVVITPGWTEEIQVYEEQYRAICNTCGADITASEAAHVRDHMLNGENGSYRNEPTKVQVGTNKVNHPAVTEKKWVVDKAAWTEIVTTGYSCSCGATK